jgi:predicted nucleic acid-binding protein
MSAGVVLDTSFLITLAGSDRANHDAARRYWRHFIENEIPIFLSTVVVSEFYVRQEIPPEILRACIPLPFNWEDAKKAAELWPSASSQVVESRVAVKDDIKIIAQAIVKDAAFLITDDADTMFRYASRLKVEGTSLVTPISLAGGFDSSHFNPGGQRDFEDALEEEDLESSQ